MVKILGLLDIISAFLLISKCFDFDIPRTIVAFFSSYLLLKAFIFLRDVGSIMDLAAGTLLILGLYMTLPWEIFVVFGILVGIKGIQSLLFA